MRMHLVPPLRQAGAAVLAVCAAALPVGVRAQGTKGTFAVKHPTVYVTQEDVARARANIGKYAWARQQANEVIKAADVWVARNDAWIDSNMPGKGACFAYGFTGCPICGATCGYWDRARASFDNPGHVTCANGHVLPDAQHPDPGTGYVAPDGRIHYLAGSYNAWAIEQFTLQGAENLAIAYSLTGDEKYAEKAARILDAVAAIYPSCDKGSWDYPSDPPSGRLDRPWYQVARVLVHLVDQYDQICASKSLDAPSKVPGLTRRANIEENMLRNGAQYCFDQSQSGGLHNGEADYVRGALAAGICLDIPEYVRWAVDGPYGIRNMLDNNIDRDGLYFETSSLYASHSRGLYLTFSEPLLNYRAPAYPNGVDLYKDTKFRNLLTLSDLALNLSGHTPPYGDSGPDTATSTAPARLFNTADYVAAGRLLVRTQSPEERTKLAKLRSWMFAACPESARAASKDLLWMLFHSDGSESAKASLSPDYKRRISGTELYGQKGIGMLRSGAEQSAQTVMLRFGPALVHSHVDDLNINYVARGNEITYDQGYSLASTHTEVGWARQTASHNLVVVDEASQFAGGGTGGSLYLFASDPGCQLIEASSESCYSAQKVTQYQRTLALLEGRRTGPEAGSYLVDIFRVKGGSQHDYMFHSRSEQVEMKGVTLGPEQPGSLAGPDTNWMSKQLMDGDIAGYPNKPYWNPPPGNGYGFLALPRQGTPAGAWSADWTLDGGTHVRLSMACEGGEQVFTALAPGLQSNMPKARYVVQRRKGENLQSAFAGVIEPYGHTPLVQSVERLPLDAGGAEVAPVALRIVRSDGAEDLIYSSGDCKPRTAAGYTFAGRFVQARIRRGRLEALSMVGAKTLQAPGWSVEAEADGWSGRVASVDGDACVAHTSTPLPCDGSLNGQIIVFSNPACSRTTGYRIDRVERDGAGYRIVLHASPVLGCGVVKEIPDGHTIVSSVLHEYARAPIAGGDNGFFAGKLIRSGSGAETCVTGTQYYPDLTLRVKDSSGFRQGESFRYMDVQAGDRFYVASSIYLTRTPVSGFQISGSSTAEVTGLQDVHVKAPGR